MSNDAKFWAARLGLAVGIVINLFALGRMINEAQKAGAGEPSYLVLWIIIWVLTIVGLVGFGFVYTRYRNKRWDASSYKTSEQIEVETLNTLARLDAKKSKDKPERQ